MENFDQIFTLLAEHEGIVLNTDILETGLINIIALDAILLFLTIKQFLPFLNDRRETIVNSIKDAENRLQNAQERLENAEKQLNQSYLTIRKIRNETESTKRLSLESYASQAKKDSTVLFERALATFRSKERQIFLEIK
jgi:F-type H+-transporting ATPase subunit b